MGIKNILFVLLASAILVGCGNSVGGKVNLPAIQPLYADSIEVPPVLLSVTSLFTVGGDTLGVYQPQDDTLFSFWKLPECKFLFKAGVRGQGPNDFLEMDKTFQGGQGSFKAFEIDAGRVKEIGFEGNALVTKKAHRLNVDQMLNRFIFLADDTYCFFLLVGDSEFALYNERDGMKPFGQYPDLINKKPDDLDVFTYNKLTLAHPDGSKFAAFYCYLKMCRIYGKDGSLLKEVYLKGPEELENGQRKFYYYNAPYAAGDYIYILAHDEEENVLEVWNWDAEMVARYSLDKADINRIMVYGDKFYGFSKINESIVYTFELNDK